MTAQLSEVETLFRQGHLQEAECTCVEICSREDVPARGWYLRGLIAFQKGDYHDAADALTKAVQMDEQDYEIHCHASEVYRRAGRISEAITAAQRAVELHPLHPAPHNNLGLALQDSEDYQGASERYQRALQLDPTYYRAYLNLGNLMWLQDRFEEAGPLYRRALELRPDYPEALNSAGQLLRAQGRPQLALDCFNRALSVRPGYPKALLNWANTLADLNRLDQAEELLLELAQNQPEYSEAFHDLGALLERRHRTQEAIIAYQRAWELKPGSIRLLSSLENARRQICDWSNREENVTTLLKATRDNLAQGTPGPLWPFVSFRFPTTAEDQLAIAREHARRIEARVQQSAKTFAATYYAVKNPPRLRIGFLSHEFRYHVVSHLMQGLFRRFDRQHFEIRAFDYSEDDGSATRQRIMEDCDEFVIIKALTPQQQAQRIAEAGIHVLVDINNYVPGGRPEIAAHRPAPIQVCHMYPGTTGAQFIDYFLTDQVVTPLHYQRYFSEKLVWLPHAYLPTNCDQSISEKCPSRSECGLPEDHFVFCSFNKADKIEPDHFSRWMRILKRVPKSVLWLRDDGPLVQCNLQREATLRDVDPQRLIFAPQMPGIGDHLARHRHADLFLDTTIHGAHGTAVDALWAGLPLLTCPGETFASRVGASLLTAMGVPELIADDLERYEERAVELATDEIALRQIRDRLCRQRSDCPLFDTSRYVQSLEKAFRRMWELYQTGQGPQSIFVD